MLVVDEEHYKSPGPHLPSPHPTSSYWHNDPSPFLLHHRTTKLPENADVIIIGSGISGAFAARKLLLESPALNLVMLEAREACWGATGRNGGHCQPQLYTNPLPVAFFEAANYAAIATLIHKHHIPCEWQPLPGGGCHAYFSQPYFSAAAQEVATLQRAHPTLGASVSFTTSPSDLRDLHVPTAVGAVVQTTAAKLSPYKLVAWLLEHLIKTSNLNLQTNTPVLSLSPSPSPSPSGLPSPSSSWAVHTPRGTITTSHVLLATNAYTPYLLPQFAALIVPVQGEMAALQAPPALLSAPLARSYVFIGTDGHDRIQDDYLVQRPVELGATAEAGGELMFGGGRAMARRAGVGVDSDDKVDREAAAYLRRKLLRVLDVEGEGGEGEELVAKREWTGIMGFSRDGWPWVGKVPDAEGLWLCGGYTGSGMPNAALAAEYTASLILASIKGEDTAEVERIAVEKGEIPRCYIITKERIERARELPRVGEKGG